MHTEIQTIEPIKKQYKSNRTVSKAHYKLPVEDPFTIDQLEDTTVLLGGITPGHDYLIEGSLQGLGYKCKSLPNTDLTAFQYGRDNGNHGYCNPTYFTSGNLIKFLKNLEAQGMDREEIIEKYVFLTTGCNAPCRFRVSNLLRKSCELNLYLSSRRLLGLPHPFVCGVL